MGEDVVGAKFGLVGRGEFSFIVVVVTKLH